MSYKTILEQYAIAVYNKDVERFISIYDRDVFVYDTWKEWSIKDIDQLKNMATEWFQSLGPEKVKVEFIEINTIKTINQTIWIGEVKYYAIDEKDQIIRSISNRLTWVIKDNNGIFKVVHEHSSLPINIETFKGILKKE